MAQVIKIFVGDYQNKIEWSLSEYFGELAGKKFVINNMAAEQIEEISDLSSTAKLLLSAVAGAVIQYLMDKDIDIDKIFSQGYFIVE